MIVAARFGWAAVAGPQAMSFRDFMLAVQFIAEETVGAPGRLLAAQARAREDAAAARVVAAASEAPPR